MKLAGSERAELSARTAVTAVSEHERLQSGSELVPDPGDPPVAVRGYGSARPSAGNRRPHRPIRRSRSVDIPLGIVDFQVLYVHLKLTSSAKDVNCSLGHVHVIASRESRYTGKQ